MNKKFCDDCKVEMNNLNTTHRTSDGNGISGHGIWITIPAHDWCNACVLKRITSMLSNKDVIQRFEGGFILQPTKREMGVDAPDLGKPLGFGSFL